ncbi:response regulator [Vibrio fluvialis]|nr:response regulator [Vibrio fluvialis]
MPAPMPPIYKNLLNILWLPLIIFALGYLVTSYLDSQQQQQNHQTIQRELDARLKQISEGVVERVSLYQYGIRGVRGAVMTSRLENFDYAQMQAYTKTRDYPLEFPGARGFGFIRFILPDQKDDFVAKARADRPDNSFDIRTLTAHNDSLFVIQYIEPENRNKQAVGLDIGSESMRREAALNAARFNEVRLTAPITLVQASKKTKQGFLILMPIYQHNEVPARIDQRLQELAGWSYAPILIDEVLSSVSGLNDDVTLSISDITNGSPLPFFSRGTGDATTSYNTQQIIWLFGRDWSLNLTAKQSFIDSLPLPANEYIYREILGSTLVMMLIVFSIQLIAMRRTQATKHKAELALATEKALKEANALLELQVIERTQQMAKINALQRTILSSAGYAIIATDLDGIITVFNPSAEKLLGYTAKEMIGVSTPSRFHLMEEVSARAKQLSSELGENIQPGFDVFVAKARLGFVDITRWTYVHKNGHHIPIRLIVSCLLDDNQEPLGYLGIADDLTDMLQREKELAEAKELAEQANRAKSDFLANMSHELRTPMNAILGLLQIAQNTDLNKQQRDYLNKTQNAAQSLLVLLNDILDFSKVEAGKMEIEQQPFSLPELMHETGILLSSNLQHKHLEIIYQIDEDVPSYLVGDSLRLRQILLNLAGNAIKFTEEGEVKVAISTVEHTADHYVLRVTVTDTGIGMTDEQQSVIFKGFSQAESSISRRYGGTGLGLSIVKHLVSLMDGTVEVKSQLGVGSEFSFTVSLGCVEEWKLPEPAAALPNGLNVLIVEDNNTARLIFDDLLKRFGCKVTSVADAEQALPLIEQADANLQPFDLLFIDWKLPGMDGLSLTQTVRSQLTLKKTPQVVMATAFGRELLDEHLEETQSLLDALLVKPVTPDMVKNTLLDVVNNRNKPRDEQLGYKAQSQALLGLKLLLVEDNSTNRLVATELLSQQGATVVEAESGTEALAALTQQEFSLVLMDVQMPGMDGYETTRRIRQIPHFADLPILAMTANAMPEDKVACLNAGMDDHIAKPFHIGEVAEKILQYTSQLSPPEEHKTETETKLKDLTQAALQYGETQHIDVMSAIERLGDTAIYARVVQQFADDIQQAIPQFQQQELPAKEARLLYHSLKSGAASCGLTSLAQKLQQAEQYCAQDPDSVIPRNSSLLAEVLVARSKLNNLYELLTADNEKSTETADEIPELDSKIEQLVHYLKTSNMAAMSLFDEISEQLQYIDAYQTAELSTHMQNLAFDQAAAILGQIKKTKGLADAS